MLIALSLGLLLTITFLNVVLGADFSNYRLSTEYSKTIGINDITGALAIIIVLVAIAILVGFNVLGSGISDEAAKIVILIIGYGSVWGFFSILAINLIIAIEIFGWSIYIFLTIMYAIGVLSKISQ